MSSRIGTYFCAQPSSLLNHFRRSPFSRAGYGLRRRFALGELLLLARVRIGTLTAEVQFERFQQRRGIVGGHRLGEIQVVDRVTVLCQMRLESTLPLAPDAATSTSGGGD